MTARADHPFRSILRTSRTALIASVVWVIGAYVAGVKVGDLLLAFVCAYALAFGASLLVQRKDIAAVVRARREG